MFFNFINKCQEEILRRAPPSSHVCDISFIKRLFCGLTRTLAWLCEEYGCIVLSYMFLSWSYTLQSKRTLYSCLNFKELLAPNSPGIWSLNDCNGIQTHNHLLRKQLLNHLTKLASLAKCLSVGLRTKFMWVRVPLQPLIQL